MKQGLLKKISQLGKELPLNTLDELIDKFGGPEKVSEVRGGRGGHPSPSSREIIVMMGCRGKLVSLVCYIHIYIEGV